MLEPEGCEHENAKWTGVTMYISPPLYEWACPDCGFEWLQHSKDELGRPYTEGKEPVKNVEEGYVEAPYIPAYYSPQPRNTPVGAIFYLEWKKSQEGKKVNRDNFGETVVHQSFASLVKRAVDVKSAKWVAHAFQVPVSAVERWSSGASEPKTSMKRYIKRELTEGLGIEFENNEDVEVNVELSGEISVNPPDPLELLNLCIQGNISEKMVVDVYPDEVTRYLEEHPYWERSYSSIFQLKGPEGKPGSVREHNGWHWAEETRIGLRPCNSWHEVVRKIAAAECRGEIEVLLQIKLGMDTQELQDFLYGK